MWKDDSQNLFYDANPHPPLAKPSGSHRYDDILYNDPSDSNPTPLGFKTGYDF